MLGAMNPDQAAQEATRLEDAHPGRRWLVRERAEGEWTVAEVKLPPGMSANPPLKETVEQKPKPPEPDDPRTSYDRNVGGPWVG